jgi:hypothetical protein
MKNLYLSRTQTISFASCREKREKTQRQRKQQTSMLLSQSSQPPNNKNMQQYQVVYQGRTEEPNQVFSVPLSFEDANDYACTNSDRQPNKRNHLILSDSAADVLDELAELQGITKSEALIKALATERYFLMERNKKSKVFLQKENKTIEEVYFR